MDSRVRGNDGERGRGNDGERGRGNDGERGRGNDGERGRGNDGRGEHSQRGFSLIEVLIALMILAVASTLILQRTRGQLDYAARARAHYQAASDLLDRSALLPTLDTTRLWRDKQPDRILFHATDHDGVAYVLRNFSTNGIDVSIGEAMGPWQTTTLDGARGRSLVVLTPEPEKDKEQDKDEGKTKQDKTP